MTGQIILWAAVTIAAVIWLYMLVGHGQFWRADQRLDADNPPAFPPLRDGDYPAVIALVPARNEADVIAQSIGSIQAQDYPGSLSIVVTDDASEDGTGDVLRGLGSPKHSLDVVAGTGPQAGWAGKLYALHQARHQALATHGKPVYWWLTDADIAHDPGALTRLVTQSEGGGHDLVSTMVRLRDDGRWPGLMIPAFIYFFQMLYPFRLINKPTHPMAGAAGGCVLLRADALERVGGFDAYRDALIDDCSLAQVVKKTGGSLWLGLSQTQHSIRPYEGLGEIWRMVSRSAFTQLNYSVLQLLGTCIGMGLVFMAAPLATGVGMAQGLILGDWLLAVAGLTVWAMIAGAYVPMLRWYERPLWEAWLLPMVAFFYTLMTLDSARRHWQGQGGTWKGRHQAGENTTKTVGSL
ncbi:MAG: glycosyltransferase [Pseudomonadota bacterium]